jgi:hypothetical protein
VCSLGFVLTSSVQAPRMIVANHIKPELLFQGPTCMDKALLAYRNSGNIAPSLCSKKEGASHADAPSKRIRAALDGILYKA